MKRKQQIFWAALLSLCVGNSGLFAQTFTANTATKKDKVMVDMPITVSGLSKIDTFNFGLESICFEVAANMNQSSFSLVAPDGTEAQLFSEVYRNYSFEVDNYGGYYCLTQNSTKPIQLYNTPDPNTQSYRPNMQTGSLNNGQSPNGIWHFRITNPVLSDVSLINLKNVTLAFGTKPFKYTPLKTSTLPILKINTNNSVIINDSKINANLSIIYNGVGKINTITDDAKYYQGSIGIEHRGNRSLLFGQRPFSIETKNATGASLDTSLFGMPSENDWILLANYGDHSFVRNPLVHKLYEEMGRYAPRIILVEVVLNGTYHGVYAFCEKIKRDKGRVDIAKLKPTDISGNEVTGGFLLKSEFDIIAANPIYTSTKKQLNSCSHILNIPLPIYYEYPKLSDLKPEQLSYIQNYLKDFEAALFGTNFKDPINGYRKYIGMETFIDYFLMTEVSGNKDGFRRSFYMHKDKDNIDGTFKKLKAGPVWDYDVSQVNFIGIDASPNPEAGFYHHECSPAATNVQYWYMRLLEDPAFANEVKCRYVELRKTILSEANITAKIDSFVTIVAKSAPLHYATWSVEGRWPILYSENGNGNDRIWGFEEEIRRLKLWHKNRLAWLDANMPGTAIGCADPLSTNAIEKTNELSAYPIPFDDKLSISLKNSDFTAAFITLTDQKGRVLYTEQTNESLKTSTYTIENLSNLSKGIYFLQIIKDNTINTLKVVK